MDGVPASAIALARGYLSLPELLGALWLVPVSFLATALVCALTLPVAERRFLAAKGAHWTEVARHAHAFGLTLRACAAGPFLWAVIATIGTNPLAPVPRVAIGAFAWLAGFVPWLAFALRATRRLRGDSVTFREVLRASVFRFVTFWSLVVTPMAIGASLPPGLDRTSLVVIAGGLVVLLGWWAGGSMAALRLLGLAKPAGSRVGSLVSRVAGARGVEAKSVWELDLRMVNAFANPFRRSVFVTRGALEKLDDVELEAVIGHELGHVAEPRWMVLARASPLAGMGLALMLVRTELESPVLATVLLAAVVLLSRGVVSLARRGEENADRSAISSESAPGVYARALETMAKANLLPVVSHEKRAVHPHLYDRLVAAGVTPDYPRPAPPPLELQQRARLLTLAPLVGLVMVLSSGVFDLAAGTPLGEVWAMAVSGETGTLRLAARRASSLGRHGDALALFDVLVAQEKTKLARLEHATELALLGRCGEASAEVVTHLKGGLGDDDEWVAPMWTASGCPKPPHLAHDDD